MQLICNVAHQDRPGVRTLGELVRTKLIEIDAFLVKSETHHIMLEGTDDPATGSIKFELDKLPADISQLQVSLKLPSSFMMSGTQPTIERRRIVQQLSLSRSPDGDIASVTGMMWQDSSYGLSKRVTDPSALHPLLALQFTKGSAVRVTIEQLAPFALTPYDARLRSPNMQLGGDGLGKTENAAKMRKADSAFAKAFEAVAADPQFSKLAFILVDLARQDLFAAKDPDTTWSVASLGKIAVLYAAFELKAAVNRSQPFLDPAIIRGQEQLFPLLEKIWKDRIAETLGKHAWGQPGLPAKLSLGRIMKLEGNLPRATASFISTPLHQFLTQSRLTAFEKWLRSKVGPRPLSNYVDEHDRLRLEDDYDRGVIVTEAFFNADVKSKVGFLERLKMMAGFSHNASTDACIGDMGFPYLNACLVAGGFFRLPDKAPKTGGKSAGGGLWIGALYTSPAVAGPGAKLQWQANPGGGGFQSGTAIALGRLFTLMAHGKLVDAASSASMRQMTNKVLGSTLSAGTSSYFRKGLDRAPRALHSKIGYGSPFPDHVLEADKSKRSAAFYTEGAIIQTEGPALHYVVASLNAGTYKIGDQTLGALAKALEHCLELARA